MAAPLSELRIPKALRDDVEQIIGLTDGFCAERLGARGQA